MDKNKQNIILAWVLIGLACLVMYSSMNYIWSAMDMTKQF